MSTETVPFLDVRAAYEELRGEIDAALSRVAASGWNLWGPSPFLPVALNIPRGQCSAMKRLLMTMGTSRLIGW